MSASPPITGIYLTAAEVGGLLRVSSETLRRWRADPQYGFPRPTQVCRKLLFKADEVAAFLERHRATIRGEG
jgi:hypothetical protein